MRVYFLATVLVIGSVVCDAYAESWPPANVSSAVKYAPKPAPRPGLHGSGVFVVRVHMPSGQVTQVIVALSTGNSSLDESATATLKRWRFKPGATPYQKAPVPMSPRQTPDETFVKVPITFLSGLTRR